MKSSVSIPGCMVMSTWMGSFLPPLLSSIALILTELDEMLWYEKVIEVLV